MGDSHKRRRAHKRTLRRLREHVGKLIDQQAKSLRRTPTGSLRESLIDEVVRYTDPWYFDGMDAALPAHLDDPIKSYLTCRLVGAAPTLSEQNELANRLTVPPDHTFNDWRFMKPSYPEVLAAHRARHLRRARTARRLAA
jgi:hypothetical protein